MKESTGGNEIWSRVELNKLAGQRIDAITKEFAGGFDFLASYPKSVTFFGGTNVPEGSKYYEDARALAGKIVSELGYSVFSGGGPGIMEAANRGAFEAGGKSLGLLIELSEGQVTNKYITDEFSSYYFFTRKVLLSFSSEAFIFYPGGFGTLDEFFEMLTLVQTKKISNTPLICVGSEYWNELKKFIVKEIDSRGLIGPGDIDLFHVLDDHAEVVEVIKKVPVRIGLPFSGGGQHPIA